MVLMIISKGTARNRPALPHIHPQNITATKIETVFACAAFPSAIGASRNPSSEVMTTETEPTARIMVSVWNWTAAAAADAIMMIVGPKYGMQLRIGRASGRERVGNVVVDEIVLIEYS